MSGATLPRKTGLIFAVVTFALGLTAATALGWETEQNKDRNHGKEQRSEDRDHDKGQKNKDRDHDKGQNNKGRDHDKGENKGGDHDKGNQPVTPNVTTPAPQPGAPTVTTPPAVAPPAPAAVPVTPQGSPTPTPGENGENGGGGGDKPTQLAQEGAPEGPALAPASEREELAKTGLDPALMALLGVFCLGGGVFLFKRAFAR